MTLRSKGLRLGVAQFADGFGGRFHGVLVGLYALQLGGLDGFAGFASASMLGAGLSAVAAGWMTSRLGGATTMRIAGLVLLASRLLTYALLPLGLPIAGLAGLRLFGGIAGSLVGTAVKTQVPVGERASISLAWLNVSSGGGQATAALAAGLLSMSSPSTIALLGAPIALAATWPMVRLSVHSTAAPVPLREQARCLRIAGAPIVTGASVFLVLNAIPNLADGFTVDLYSEGWLGPLSVAAFAGSTLAAATMRWQRSGLARLPDPIAWAALAGISVSGWALVDRGVVWLLVARFTTGFVAQTLAASVEARVLEHTGRESALPALSASSAVASVGGAAVTGTLPAILDHLGFAGMAAASVVLLLAIGSVGAADRARRRRGRAPATVAAVT